MLYLYSSAVMQLIQSCDMHHRISCNLFSFSVSRIEVAAGASHMHTPASPHSLCWRITVFIGYLPAVVPRGSVSYLLRNPSHCWMCSDQSVDLFLHNAVKKYLVFAHSIHVTILWTIKCLENLKNHHLMCDLQDLKQHENLSRQCEETHEDPEMYPGKSSLTSSSYRKTERGHVTCHHTRPHSSCFQQKERLSAPWRKMPSAFHRVPTFSGNVVWDIYLIL